MAFLFSFPIIVIIYGGTRSTGLEDVHWRQGYAVASVVLDSILVSFALLGAVSVFRAKKDRIFMLVYVLFVGLLTVCLCFSAKAVITRLV